MNADHQNRLNATMAHTSTPQLKAALRTLEAKPKRNEYERAARSWTIEELERRFPTASAAVEAAFAASDAAYAAGGTEAAKVDYVAVLLANIPG